MTEKELTERERKIKEIRFSFKESKNGCNLCSYWRYQLKHHGYDFCVEHKKEFEQKLDEEIKKWDESDKEVRGNGQK